MLLASCFPQPVTHQIKHTVSCPAHAAHTDGDRTEVFPVVLQEEGISLGLSMWVLSVCRRFSAKTDRILLDAQHNMSKFLSDYNNCEGSAPFLNLFFTFLKWWFALLSNFPMVFGLLCFLKFAFSNFSFFPAVHGPAVQKHCRRPHPHRPKPFAPHLLRPHPLTPHPLRPHPIY